MKWTFKVYFINNVNRNLEKYFLAVLVFVDWITWGIYCRTTCKRNLIVPHLSELRKSLGFSKNLRCLEDSLSSEREGLEPRQPLRLSISVVSTANSLCWFSIVSQIILNLLTKHILSYNAVDQKSFPCLMALFPLHSQQYRIISSHIIIHLIFSCMVAFSSSIFLRIFVNTLDSPGQSRIISLNATD